jgi:thiol-disulfide isomerase/thioredoxin
VTRRRTASRRGRWSLVWLGVIAALAVLLAVLATVPLIRGEQVPATGRLVGRPAPAIDASDLDGRRWTLGEAGGRLVWINFWATWCPPCRTEMPAMQALAERHPEDLLILGVNWGEERSAVADFVDRYAIGYPILLDPKLENYYRWAPDDGLPRHYFVGPDGTVLREVIGPLEPDAMTQVLDDLLP